MKTTTQCHILHDIFSIQSERMLYFLSGGLLKKKISLTIIITVSQLVYKKKQTVSFRLLNYKVGSRCRTKVLKKYKINISK